MRTRNWVWVLLLGLGQLGAQNRWAQPLIEQEQWPLLQQQLNRRSADTLSALKAPYWWQTKAAWYSAHNQAVLAYHALMRAQKGWQRLGRSSERYEAIRLLAHLLIHQNNLKQKPDYWLNAYQKWAKMQSDSTAWAEYCVLRGDWLLAHGQQKDAAAMLDWYQKAYRCATPLQDPLRSKIRTNMALIYIEMYGNAQQALRLLDQDLLYLQRTHQQQGMLYNYINRADAYRVLGQYTEAKKWLERALQLPLTRAKSLHRSYILDFLATNEHQLHQDALAYQHLRQSMQLAEKTNESEQNARITELQTRFETQRKALENAELKIKNRNIGLGLGGSVLLLMGFGAWSWIRQDRLRKARLLALAEKEAADQALQATLRKQEVQAVAALMEGQERERRRIAAELHDNLGNRLAVLRHQLGQLQTAMSDTPQQSLLASFESQLLELYSEVRQLAHRNHQGVMADQGLEPALQQLILHLNQSTSTQFYGHFHELKVPIPPELEIAIFRVIQEAVSNILKHAQAQRADIQLIRNATGLYVGIEDNGRGFEPSTLQHQGMGLRSIETRLLPWGGRCRWESQPGQGTHLHIDIPL